MRRGTQKTLWSAVLVTVAVLGYQLFADGLGRRWGLGGSVLPTKDDRLRVVNWNIHNFPDCWIILHWKGWGNIWCGVMWMAWICGHWGSNMAVYPLT